MRGAVGDDCAIACRIAVDRMGALGVDLDEGLEFVRLADHLVDLWDVTVGSIAEWALDSGPSRFFAEGWQLESTARVREATAKPIVGVSRLTDPDLMAEIVRSGVWDLIGAARPSIADPFLPRKIDEGRVDEIRECIGCNVCISKADSRRHIGCTQNATAGEEHRRGWHPERFAPLPRRASTRSWSGAARPAWSARSRSPAAARRASGSSSARRRWAAISACSRACPGLAEWGRADRLPDGRAQADAERRARQRPRAERAPRSRRDAAAAVVLATGSHWATDGLNGFTRAPIPGAEAARGARPDARAGRARRASARRPGRVVVYDGEGYLVGARSPSCSRARGARSSS